MFVINPKGTVIDYMYKYLKKNKEFVKDYNNKFIDLFIKNNEEIDKVFVNKSIDLVRPVITNYINFMIPKVIYFNTYDKSILNYTFDYKLYMYYYYNRSLTYKSLEGYTYYLLKLKNKIYEKDHKWSNARSFLYAFGDFNRSFCNFMLYILLDYICAVDVRCKENNKRYLIIRGENLPDFHYILNISLDNALKDSEARKEDDTRNFLDLFAEYKYFYEDKDYNGITKSYEIYDGSDMYLVSKKVD